MLLYWRMFMYVIGEVMCVIFVGGKSQHSHLRLYNTLPTCVLCCTRENALSYNNNILLLMSSIIQRQINDEIDHTDGGQMMRRWWK